MAAKKSGKSNGFIRFIRVIFILLNVAAVILLGGSYLAPWISPVKNAWLPFTGLAYPLLVLLNLGFVIAWLFFNWRWSLLSLLALAAGFFQIRNHFQLSGEHIFSENEFPVKVMSYNVRNFDMYNYKNDWSYTFDNRNKIYDYLHNENADILCFQEFVHDLTGEFKTIDTIPEFQKAVNIHAEYTFTSRKIIQFGISTFTAFPIVGKGRIDFENSAHNLCIYTDMLIREDTVRVYNAHFESIHFGKQEYELAEDLSEAAASDSHQKAGRRMLSLLKAAFADRAAQVEKVAEHIGQSPYPVILCTDLNDTPASYAYRRLSSGLDDAFVKSGRGMGTTYQRIFPGFRIDYIFHSSDCSSYNCRVRSLDYSDHYPVVCDIIIKENE